uniref:MAE-28990/MAE-18760-like HEPN domain-containing protein n=1 Tax=Candidatus Kentrum sp. FW TaxID=2126338 RepID=A0A450TNC5_9GAMM|nr:MAG: hypothetical protein BECKFW1821C_GA0114237_101835 [Candidatus Kentron sp. FW]
MNNLEQELQGAFSHLEKKISQARTLHIRYEMMEEHRLFLIRQSILSIYAAWEGFLKESLRLYLGALNQLDICYDELSDEYLAYQTDKICAFKDSRKELRVIQKVSVQLLETYKGIVNFDTKINTESNANLSITNSLLRKLSLQELSGNYQKGLDKLLFFRNSTAHGEDTIPIEQKDLDTFGLLVQNLSSDLILSILDGFTDRVYLKTA